MDEITPRDLRPACTKKPALRGLFFVVGNLVFKQP